MEINTKINELFDSRNNLISKLKTLHQKKIDIRTAIGNITSKLAVDKAELSHYIHKLILYVIKDLL